MNYEYNGKPGWDRSPTISALLQFGSLCPTEILLLIDLKSNWSVPDVQYFYLCFQSRISILSPNQPKLHLKRVFSYLSSCLKIDNTSNYLILETELCSSGVNLRLCADWRGKKSCQITMVLLGENCPICEIKWILRQFLSKIGIR